MTEYGNLRFWYLHELCRLRAAARVNGHDTRKERRGVQQKLADLRKSTLEREA